MNLIQLVNNPINYPLEYITVYFQIYNMCHIHASTKDPKEHLPENNVECELLSHYVPVINIQLDM